MTSSEQKYELSNSSRVRPARNLELTTSSEQKYELSSSSLQTWNRWVELECASELKPKPCDRNALALVNKVNLQQQHMFNTRATLSCRYLQSWTSASYFIPFFLSSSFLVIYTDTNKAKKTRIDSLISVLRARGNGSVNFRKFLASVRHDFAGFSYIGADLWNKICVLYYLLKSTTLSTSKFEICQH